MILTTDLSKARWSETRIYTADQSEFWYLHLLAVFAKPFQQQFASAPFWFTRYECANRYDPPPANFRLEPHFLFPVRDMPEEWGSRSIRFRFVGSIEKEEFFRTQKNLVPNIFSETPIELYDPVVDIAGAEGCSSLVKETKEERANLLSHLLSVNARLVLHALSDAPPIRFESNAAERLRNSSFRRPLHLISNVYGDATGADFMTLLANPKFHAGHITSMFPFVERA